MKTAILCHLQEVPRYAKQKKTRRNPGGAVTVRQIMSAILLIKGPVCNTDAINKNGPVAVRHIVKSQFLQAANALEKADLGYMGHVIMEHPKQVRTVGIFIKKVPSEIGQSLKGNEDLCSLDEYTARFHMPAPACIRPKMREQLVKQELVKEEYFSQKYFGLV